MHNEYPYNATLDIKGTFRNKSGALANTTATLKVKKPVSGTETTYSSPTNLSTGVYEQTGIVLNEPGTWYYRWVGTVTVLATNEFSFVVKETKFTTP